ncbi:MAG: glutathione S-transferase [Deltaproteobacteria bacterium]|nr:glutathione S-transferase [Deltaproteobacteria bacterium]
MITVHHLEDSRSQRILWLLEELAVPYEIIHYKRDKKTMLAPPELQKIHPLGKSPVITDGDQTVAESAVILEYLVETYGAGRLVPTVNTPAYRHYRYFMHYAESSLMPYLLLKLIFTKIKTSPMPFFVKPIARKIADNVSDLFVDPNLKRHLGFLDAHLTKHPWVAGEELTVADMQMSYPIIAAVERGTVNMPASLVAYAAKLKALPAYQRAVAKGGE